MFDELIGSSDINETCESYLRNDGAELTAGCRDTMCSRTITGRESLPGNDESRCIRAKVLEEVGETVKEHECIRDVRVSVELAEGET